LRYLIRENAAFLGYDPLPASPRISAGYVSRLADRDTMNAGSLSNLSISSSIILGAAKYLSLGMPQPSLTGKGFG